MQLVEPEAGQRVSIVLAGDHQQLGPHVLSVEARNGGLDCSLFERLISVPVYAEHPLSRRKMMRHSLPKVPYHYPPFIDLCRNYRSYKSILGIPSELSYNSSLIACAENVDTIAKAIQDQVPVSFIGHGGSEDSADLDIITSWYNETEIHLIVKKVKQLLQLNRAGILPRDIVMLAPFQEQVQRLRLALRTVKLGSIGVGTVEDYQGAESRIVILSIVRSSQKYLERDLRNGVGVINQKRRLNVALTRAKEMLVVVGNPDLLNMDADWKVWLSFCIHNRSYCRIETVHLEREKDRR